MEAIPLKTTRVLRKTISIQKSDKPASCTSHKARKNEPISDREYHFQSTFEASFNSELTMKESKKINLDNSQHFQKLTKEQKRLYSEIDKCEELVIHTTYKLNRHGEYIQARQASRKIELKSEEPLDVDQMVLMNQKGSLLITVGQFETDPAPKFYESNFEELEKDTISALSRLKDSMNITNLIE